MDHSLPPWPPLHPKIPLSFPPQGRGIYWSFGLKESHTSPSAWFLLVTEVSAQMPGLQRRLLCPPPKNQAEISAWDLAESQCLLNKSMAHGWFWLLWFSALPFTDARFPGNGIRHLPSFPNAWCLFFSLYLCMSYLLCLHFLPRPFGLILQVLVKHKMPSIYGTSAVYCTYV